MLADGGDVLDALVEVGLADRGPQCSVSSPARITDVVLGARTTGQRLGDTQDAEKGCHTGLLGLGRRLTRQCPDLLQAYEAPYN